MQSSQGNEPEITINAEPFKSFLDTLMTLRDHANQWDLAAIWHAPRDPESDSLDWDRLLAEVSR